jgi:hypothetical protein
MWYLQEQRREPATWLSSRSSWFYFGIGKTKWSTQIESVIGTIVPQHIIDLSNCSTTSGTTYSATDHTYSATDRTYSTTNHTYSTTDRTYSTPDCTYSATVGTYSTTIGT